MVDFDQFNCILCVGLTHATAYTHILHNTYIIQAHKMCVCVLIFGSFCRPYHQMQIVRIHDSEVTDIGAKHQAKAPMRCFAEKFRINDIFQ